MLHQNETGTPTRACVCGSIYSNFLPFVTPEAMTMYNDVERALYASL